MNTDVQVEEIRKEERRKVFKVMNTLPWIISILTLIVLIFVINKKQALNVTPPLTNTKALVEPTQFSNEQTNVYTQLTTNWIVCVKTNFITKTNWVVATNFIQTINNEEFLKRWDILESNLYKKAQQDIRVEAVSNGYARWNCTVEGVAVFEWRNELLNVNTPKEIGPKITNREYPFTYRNMSLAKSVNLDIEKELRKSIFNVIDGDFIEFAEENNLDKIKIRLQDDVDMAIKELFDGFETYNRTKN